MVVQQPTGETKESYFDGSVLEFVLYQVVMAIVSALTLGIAFPWLFCFFKKWEVSHKVINGQRLEFTGMGVDLIWQWIKWILLTIVTIGIYGFWVPVKILQWETKHTKFI